MNRVIASIGKILFISRRTSLPVFMLLAFQVIAMPHPALGLKQITQLAIDNNRDLKSARYAVSLASARLVQAGLWPNPGFNVSNNDDRLFNNEGEYTRSAGFTQAFPISGRIARQKSVARVDVEKAMAEIREAERTLSAAVANAFYAVIITERRLRQVRYLSGLNQQLVQVTQNRYHVAEVSELDNNTARLEYQRINQEKHLLHSVYISQLALLNQLLGRSAATPLVLDAALPVQRALPALKALQARALDGRPDRQAILLGISRANADWHLARAERFADWTLGLAVQQDKISVQGAPAQPADRSLAVSVSIPLPILNANQGRILEASVGGTQAVMALRAINLTIETGVASSYAQLQALKNTLRQTENTSLKLTLRNVELAREAYKNGQLSLLDVIQVQRQQNDLQMAYLANLEKYLQAYVALCTAIGPGRPLALCDYLSFKRNLNGHHLAFPI